MPQLMLHRMQAVDFQLMGPSGRGVSSPNEPSRGSGVKPGKIISEFE
jgi:hypothetical protein